MSNLTGRETLLRVFYQQPTDRIPVSPFIHINYVKEFYSTHDVDWVTKTPEVYRHFGFDVMHRNCTPDYDAYGQAGPGWQMETTCLQKGRDETKTTVVHTPEGDLRFVEASRWVCEYDAETSTIEYPIKCEADLELMIRYQPAVEQADTRDIVRAKAAVGEDGVVAPWVQGVFNLVAYHYRKLDELLIDALVNPDFYHRMMTYFTDRYMPYLQQVIDARPEVLSFSANIANGKLVSPEYFRQYVWPYDKRLIDYIQEQGVAVLYHNCGYARTLLPVYPSLGLRAYESLTPLPYGDTVLAEAVEAFGRSTALVGNIDQIDLLRKGTAAEIEAQIQEVLDTVRGRSSFILATTDYFNENTPHDNIHALADAGHKYGRC